MRNGGSGRTKVVPAGASNPATKAGTGASANKDGMRSLARRDTHANNMATGTDRTAKSNAPATVITDSPQILASGRTSLHPPYRYVRAADLQQFERPQRDKAGVAPRIPPNKTTTAHHPWPSATAAVSNLAFATNPPLGGRPMRDTPPSAKANTVIGSARPIPDSPAIRSCPSASAINPAAMNMAALAKACEMAWRTPPVQAVVFQGSPISGLMASGNIRNR